jgi:hypothetical protein
LFQLTGILFETHGRSVVFTCEPRGLCLKLIRSKRIFAIERLAYEQLRGDALQLFLPLLFFCKVTRGAPQGGSSWRGYCMRQGQYSLRDILYKSPRHTEAEYQAVLQTLLLDRQHPQEHPPQQPPAPDEGPRNGGGGGMPVLFKPNQTVQLSLCLTALRLLHALHQAGWVHGDSHLGNFIYADGRLYAIDFERSFCTTDVVQHFLDIQELFGHLSSILVHMERPHEWDMKDIQAIYFHRHPLFGQMPRVGLPSPLQRRIGLPMRRMALYMLPLCTCFTCPKQAIRVKGCLLCNSEFNRHSAHVFATRSKDVLSDLEAWGLSRLRASLLQTRNECIQRCTYVANIIYPCLSDGLALLANGHAHNDVLRLPVKELTTSRQTCCVALKRLLYAPCVSAHALAVARLLCDRLHQAGHTEAARVLWLYVAWDKHTAPVPIDPAPPPAAMVLPTKRAQCCLSSSA